MRAISLPSPIAESGNELRGPWLGRSRRVTILLAATLVMSVADLAMTLTYTTSVGMMEVNPIARAVMEMNSPWMLALWKLATAGLGLGILFRFRAKPNAEVAAWVCCVAMVALTLHWMDFNSAVTHLSDEYAALQDTSDPHWVQMAAR